MSDGPAEPDGVALCLPARDAERLTAEAGPLGIRVVARSTSAAELAARLPVLRPALVVTIAQPQYLDAMLLSRCDAHGARLLVGAASRDEHRHARDLGIAETVAVPLQWPQAAAPSRRIPPPLATDAVLGQAIVVWGASGAPGRTSLAIALAAELARSGASVALADADTRAAAVAPALGLLDEAPGFAAACRLAGLGELRRSELERVAEEVPLRAGCFSVLTGIGRPSRWPELSAERVSAVIETARGWVSRVVVDTAAELEQDDEPRETAGRNQAALAALRAADEILLVGAADPVGLARLLRAHAELAEQLPSGRVTVVVNKVRSSVVGTPAEAQLRQTLARFGGIRDPVLVPWDPVGFDAALLSARPLPEAAPRSPAAAAIRALAAARLGAAPTRASLRSESRSRRRLA